jgi:Cu2+-exporting ATPase
VNSAENKPVNSSVNNPSTLQPLSCYHCGLPVDKTGEFVLTLQQQARDFCCPGCLAVATIINDDGLEQFYQYRSQLNRRPKQQRESFALYDRDDVQRGFVTHHHVVRHDDAVSGDVNNINDTAANSPERESTAHLLLDDITCAACVWLIEQHLQSIAGVVSVRVSADTHQCAVCWNRQQVSLSQLMMSLEDIGYRPHPFSEDKNEERQQRYQRMALMRLGVAGFGMMQVGMVAIALYAGDMQGIDDQWWSLLRWVSLIVATPVILFSAQPLWSTAYKNILRGHLTMEVPVSIAIILAYSISVWATTTGTGEVYFDSVSMFTFFLLWGRYLEMRTRYKNRRQTHATTRLLPLIARRMVNDRIEEVVLDELTIGDRVHIAAGNSLPCDGEVIQGVSTVNESLITGEAEPVRKQIGDQVIAGTVNMDGTLIIRATATQQATRLSTIERLTTFAEQDKPRAQQLANTVARYFVAAVLVGSAAVYTFWYFHQPEMALWITLSVLVVTCPCALSLATPAVLTATLSRMRTNGLLVLKGHVIETLAQVTRVVFDKTGTLTYGKPCVVKITIVDGRYPREQVLAIAAAIERGSSHPIAHAFIDYEKHYRVDNHVLHTGVGVEGSVSIDGKDRRYFLGKPTFLDANMAPPAKGQWLLLSGSNNDHDSNSNDEQSPIAWICLSDELRASANNAVADLQKNRLAVDILSGDHVSVVRSIANNLGVLSYQAGVMPEEKLAYIRQLQANNDTVLMLGDGINDVPVLAGADVSIAMGSASDFARTHADAILLNNDLTMLAKNIALAHRCKSIMRQNMAWALAYNFSVLPLAAAGFIPPYLAAIGMSLSSLVVVINALRV